MNTKKVVLSGGELRDADVNFDTYSLSNFKTASYVRFPCHSTAFLSVMQTAVNHLSKSEKYTRKNQTDPTFNAGKYITWSLSITSSLSVLGSETALLWQDRSQTGLGSEM